MALSITNAIPQTWVIIGVLVVLLIVSIKKRQGSEIFPVNTTTEIKGLAILLVIFSHIGYFLVNDQRFLQPLSNYAGLGVDLFLILSGYGLVASALKRHLPLWQFYKKRLFKIYLPVALIILLFLILDFTILHRTYPFALTIKNLLGFFPRADVYTDIDSPLWFITPLLFFYILFPLTFWRRGPLVSALLVAIIGWLVVKQNLPNLIGVTPDVATLYKLHFLGFPLGMGLGAILNQPPRLFQNILVEIKKRFLNPLAANLLRAGGIIASISLFWYYSKHSAVGMNWKHEELAQLAMSLAIICLFLLKQFELRLLALLGAFSFEIYLLHWPLLSRYNILYGHLPASLATLLYLAFFVGLGYVYQGLSQSFFKRIKLT